MRLGLGLADAVHLRAADWADTLGSGSTVLQGHLLRVPHLSLGAALKAVSLHTELPPFGGIPAPGYIDMLLDKHTYFDSNVKRNRREF
jgi:hypothetical protein